MDLLTLHSTTSVLQELNNSKKHTEVFFVTYKHGKIFLTLFFSI